jgi:hypothetical protein
MSAMSISEKLLKQMKASEEGLQSIKLKVKPPGPGSYELPCLSSTKEEYFSREKWK